MANETTVPETPPAIDNTVKAAEAAAKVEQERMIVEINSLKLRLSEVQQSAQNELGSKTQEYTKTVSELRSQIEVLQRATKSDFDPVAYAKEIATDTARILSERHAEQVKTLSDRLTSLEKEKKDANLNALRTKLIADANGKIVAAMVRGDSEESITASAELAKQEYSRIFSEVSQQPPAAPAQVVPAIMVNGTTIPIVQTGNLSPTDYNKNRPKILADIRARHG